VFSGIVETTSPVQAAEGSAQLLRIYVQTPSSFDDLKIGDSVAVNGVCLTLEAQANGQMQFALGPETLKITGWTAESVLNRAVNLERSMRLDDRVHGHLVTGHVDALAQVAALDWQEESLRVTVKLPLTLSRLVWKKGSVTLNGVSLTINSVTDNPQAVLLQVGLIPETLRRTNLGELKVGDEITVEVDNLARGLLRSLEMR